MKARHKIFYLPLLAALSILWGCQKVINVDTRDTGKKYVIEAVVTDQPGNSVVKISTSKNISESNEFPGVSGAVVSIQDNTGNSYPFLETQPGNYTNSSFTGTVAQTYRLEVKINGETFTGSSTMPQKVNLDTLYVTDEMLFGETRKLAAITYQDPPGKGNCYRYVQYINGNKSKPIFTNNDDYVDGRYIDTRLWYIVDDDDDDKEKIKSGDTVTIEMLCIDQPVYKYWYSLFQSATGNSQSASPANPVSNISGGALGYFSAHTFQSLSVQVP